eukprot:g40135.t1
MDVLCRLMERNEMRDSDVMQLIEDVKQKSVEYKSDETLMYVGLGPKRQPSCSSDAAWPGVFFQLYTLLWQYFCPCWHSEHYPTDAAMSASKPGYQTKDSEKIYEDVAR